jgi:hypothetical protein
MQTTYVKTAGLAHLHGQVCCPQTHTSRAAAKRDAVRTSLCVGLDPGYEYSHLIREYTLRDDCRSSGRGLSGGLHYEKRDQFMVQCMRGLTSCIRESGGTLCQMGDHPNYGRDEEIVGAQDQQHQDTKPVHSDLIKSHLHLTDHQYLPLHSSFSFCLSCLG